MCRRSMAWPTKRSSGTNADIFNSMAMLTATARSCRKATPIKHDCERRDDHRRRGELRSPPQTCRCRLRRRRPGPDRRAAPPVAGHHRQQGVDARPGADRGSHPGHDLCHVDHVRTHRDRRQLDLRLRPAGVKARHLTPSPALGNFSSDRTDVDGGEADRSSGVTPRVSAASAPPPPGARRARGSRGTSSK